MMTVTIRFIYTDSKTLVGDYKPSTIVTRNIVTHHVLHTRVTVNTITNPALS